MGPAERVRGLIEPLLLPSGLEVVDVEARTGVVCVTVDRPGGVDLDAISWASQSISAALDREDPLPEGRYVLEVSSPGVERSLRTPEHFQRFVGSTVTLKLVAGTEGERRIQGRLTSADMEGVTIAVPGPPGAGPEAGRDDGGAGGRRFAYSEIERARTVFEWGPAPKPGHDRKPRGQTKTKRAAAS
jgi:ribosome maturation factor RimP